MDRELLERLYHRAVDAAQPRHAIAANLPEPPHGRTIVIGAGKASAQMAQAFEEAWPHRIDKGLVVTRYGYAAPCERIEIVEAAAIAAHDAGLTPHILSDAIEGEARDVAGVHAALAREIRSRNRPFTKPAILLSGGETTVTIRGAGRGGRNAEFLLAFALAIEGQEGISALAADTDGIDGAGDNAGAWCDGTTAARMRSAGIDPRAALADNDAYNAFRAVGGLFTTGPTGTNVNDFRAIIIR